MNLPLGISARDGQPFPAPGVRCGCDVAAIAWSVVSGAWWCRCCGARWWLGEPAASNAGRVCHTWFDCDGTVTVRHDAADCARGRVQP